MAKVLPKWAAWPKRAIGSQLFEGAAYPIPTHTPMFLGTLNQRYRPRYGAPAQAFQMWINRINDRVKTRLVPALRKQGMMLPDAAYASSTVNADPYSLANIADFNTLIARSQEAGVPVFELTDEQLKVTGPLLKNMKISRNQFRQLFADLSESLITLCGDTINHHAEKRASKARKAASKTK